MKHLWNKRRLAALGAVAAVVGVTLWVVLPALGGTPTGDPGDPTTGLVVQPSYSDTGGQPNDCTLFSAIPPATDQYLTSKPQKIDGKRQTLTASDGSTVYLTVNLESSTLLDFTMSGGVVYDVGIDGGSGTDRYDYESLGGVTHDTGLHAPLQSPGHLYNLSQTTFCYSPSGVVSGTVYQDTSNPASGNLADNAGNGLAGWKVSLYENGTLLKSTTSESDGTYSLSALFNNADTYTVCEASPVSDTTSYAQSQPSGASVCSGSADSNFNAESPVGYQFTNLAPTETLGNEDFGNVAGSVTCASAVNDPPYPNYTINLNCGHKAGASFVFNHGTYNNNPWVSVWSSGSSYEEPLVEEVQFDYDPTQGQNSVQMLYDDSFPFDPASATAMPYCLVDPTTGPGSLDLAPAYTDASTKTDVLGTSGATSCLISVTTTTAEPGHAEGTYTAYVYSTADGLRTIG